MKKLWRPSLQKWWYNEISKRCTQTKGYKAFETLSSKVVKVGNHSINNRRNLDGTKTTPLTMPNHERIKGSTLRVICRQAGIKREEFLEAHEMV